MATAIYLGLHLIAKAVNPGIVYSDPLDIVFILWCSIIDVAWLFTARDLSKGVLRHLKNKAWQ